MFAIALVASLMLAATSPTGACGGTNILRTHTPEVYVINRSVRGVIYSTLHTDTLSSRWATNQDEKGQVVYISYALDQDPPIYLSMANQILVSTRKLRPGIHKITVDVLSDQTVLQRTIYCVPAG